MADAKSPFSCAEISATIAEYPPNHPVITPLSPPFECLKPLFFSCEGSRLAGTSARGRRMAEWERNPHPKGSTDSHRQSDRAKLFTPQGRGKGNSGKGVSELNTDAMDKEETANLICRERKKRLKLCRWQEGRYRITC